MSTVAEQMLKICRDYEQVHGSDPIDSVELYEWARRNNRWQPKPSTIRRQFLDQMSSALRQEYITDEQGRKVRKNHAILKEKNGKQRSFWGDIRKSSQEFMALSFSQRRKQISSDCRQLKTDVDSFNENRKPSKPYQLILDFTQDVAEMEVMEQKKVNRRKQTVRKISNTTQREASRRFSDALRQSAS